MSETKNTSVALSDRAATVGRILIYTFTGEEHEDCGRAIHVERPAIVVRAPLGSRDTYNVQVFTDCGNDVQGGGPGADGTLWLKGLRIAAEPTPGYLSWPVIEPVKTSQLARQSSAEGIAKHALAVEGNPMETQLDPATHGLASPERQAEAALQMEQQQNGLQQNVEAQFPKAPKAKKSKRSAG